MTMTATDDRADEASTDEHIAVAAVAVLDRDAIIAAMPEQAKLMVGLIGFETTLDLCQALGGQRVWFPSSPPDTGPLVEAIGRERLPLVCSQIGGSRIELPMLAAVERLLRDNAMRAEFDGGATFGDLSARYRLTRRRTAQILKASPDSAPRAHTAPRDTRTLDLFMKQAKGGRMSGGVPIVVGDELILSDGGKRVPFTSSIPLPESWRSALGAPQGEPFVFDVLACRECGAASRRAMGGRCAADCAQR